MLWLRGPAKIQELLFLPGTKEGARQAILQPPKRLDQELWLTLDCGAGGVDYYDVRNYEDPQHSVYYQLLRLRGDDGSRTDPPGLIGAVERFATEWGIPLLPELWEYECRVAPRPVYCFPLAELGRMLTFASVLEQLRQARYPDNDRKLMAVIDRLQKIPLARLLPLGGEWRPPVPLRGAKRRAELFELREQPFPAMPWTEEFRNVPVPGNLPRAYDQDPFWVLRWLHRDPKWLVEKANLQNPRMMVASVAAGVDHYSYLNRDSLWSFILSEWVHRYFRRNGVAFCRYVSPEGERCNHQLPVDAPTHRQFCDLHRRVRARERTRDHRARKKGRPTKGAKA
jgi:hypothetical protein